MRNAVGDQSKLARENCRYAVADIEKETAITVVHSTVIFRPNQMFKIGTRDGDHMIKLAEDFGIPLRFKE